MARDEMTLHELERDFAIALREAAVPLKIKYEDALREIIRIREEECNGTDGLKQANVARKALADG